MHYNSGGSGTDIKIWFKSGKANVFITVILFLWTFIFVSPSSHFFRKLMFKFIESFMFYVFMWNFIAKRNNGIIRFAIFETTHLIWLSLSMLWLKWLNTSFGAGVITWVYGLFTMVINLWFITRKKIIVLTNKYGSCNLSFPKTVLNCFENKVPLTFFPLENPSCLESPFLPFEIDVRVALCLSGGSFLF